jgi:hypothetical protein
VHKMRIISVSLVILRLSIRPLHSYILILDGCRFYLVQSREETFILDIKFNCHENQVEHRFLDAWPKTNPYNIT